MNCDQTCAPRDGGTGGGTTCANQTEITNATKACLDKNTCDELLNCKIPGCQGGSSGGTGGSGGSGATGGSGGTGGGTGGTGGGGTGGSGGTGGGTGDGQCAALLACCNAATNDQIKSACLMGYNGAMGNDALCGMILTSVKPSVCP